MRKSIQALKFSFVLLLIVSSFIACDKDFNVLESDVLGEDNVNFSTTSTTLPIVAYNKKLEALQVNNLSSNLLGYFNDPAFGSTTAGIVAQLQPTSVNPSFGTNPEIDSVVISIPYFSTIVGIDDNGNSTYKLDSIYGNSNAEINLSIYENTYFLRSFDPSSTTNASQKYYSNASSGINSVITDDSPVNFENFIGDLIYQDTSFQPSNKATVLKSQSVGDTITTETRSVPAFRVSMVSENEKLFWKTTILDKEGSSDLSSTSNFKAYFRGLYFKAEAINGDGSMTLLNLANTAANVTVYYTSGETGSRLQYAYTLNFTGNKVNTFINDFDIPLENGNSTDGDKSLYLKGSEGSMAIVDLFPNGIEDFMNEFTDADGVPTKLINEAHLLVYEDMDKAGTGSYGSDFHKYDRLYAYNIESNTPIVDFLNDPTYNTASPLNSGIISFSQRDSISGKYKIRITQLLNNILLNNSTNTKVGLVLTNNVNTATTSEILNPNDDVTGVPTSSVITPRGTVLYGSNEAVDESKRLKLKIFYTEPNQ